MTIINTAVKNVKTGNMVAIDFSKAGRYPNKGDMLYVSFDKEDSGIYQIIQAVYFQEVQSFDSGDGFYLMYLVEKAKV